MDFSLRPLSSFAPRNTQSDGEPINAWQGMVLSQHPLYIYTAVPVGTNIFTHHGGESWSRVLRNRRGSGQCIYLAMENPNGTTQ